MDYDYALGVIQQSVQGCSTISLPSGVSNITDCVFLENGLPLNLGAADMPSTPSTKASWLASSTVGMDCGSGGGVVSVQDTLFQVGAWAEGLLWMGSGAWFL